MQNSDLSQPQFDDVVRKVLEKIGPDYGVEIVENPQRPLRSGEVSYEISGNYQIDLTYVPDLKTRRKETVNAGDLEAAIREKFDEMRIPKTEAMNDEKPNLLPGELIWIEVEDRGPLDDEHARGDKELNK